MAEMNQLKRAVVELENGVQWVKALTEVGELKEETREQFQQLVDAAEQLQKKQEQAQMSAKISNEELRQQQNAILAKLTENLDELKSASDKQSDERSEYIDRLQRIEEKVLLELTENADDLLEKQQNSNDAAAEKIISELTLQLQNNYDEINSQLSSYREQIENISSKLRRRIALNRWLTLGYAVIIIAILILFKYVI